MIDINDYLSEETKEQLARDVFKDYVKGQLQSETDLKRFLSNVAYETVYKLVDDCLDGNMKEHLYDKIYKKLNDISLHEIFKRPDAWDKTYNGMYDYFQQCLEEQRPTIKAIVANNIEPVTIAGLKDNIQEMIIEAVQNIYKGVDDV